MIEKVYIVHFEPLKDRKEYLDSALKKLNIPYDYYISNEFTDKEIMDNIGIHYKYDPVILDRELTKGEISVSAAHVKIYRDILKNNFEYCLIIEDDAIFTEDFNDILVKVMEERGDYDLIFLSSCCGLHKNKTSDKLLYESDTSRCTTGYIVNRKKLEKIIEFSAPISTPIDTNLNHIKNWTEIKYAWCEPPIIEQGSENKYKSNLR